MSQGPPPPLPESRKKRSNPTGAINKAAAPEPPKAGASGTSTYVEKQDPNFVTIELKCYSSVSIKVDRGISLQSLLEVAASIAEFKLNPGTFNLWCDQVCIENEGAMKKLWAGKATESHIVLSCHAIQ